MRATHPLTPTFVPTPRALRLLLLLLGPTLAACPAGQGTAPPDAAGADAGGSVPADAARMDADAASAPDAAPTDADQTADAQDARVEPDAEVAPDAAPDAGPPTDAGIRSLETLLEHWFDTYNAGLGTAYLTAPHNTFPGGDPRYPAAPAHQYLSEVAYGPHPRNVLDAWILPGGPGPIAVFMHGGGFQQGSKDDLHQDPQVIPGLLAVGISVAAINYRYAFLDPQQAVNATNPDGEGSTPDVNGARLDYILRDCARAIQFLRYQAPTWGLDPSRIGAWGGSAGAGCAAWVAAMPDLARPGDPDPVLAQSSRLSVVAHLDSQPTYNFPRWPALLSFDPAFVFGLLTGEAVRLTQLSWPDLTGTTQGQELSVVLDFYEALGAGDPPFYTANTNPDLDQAMITSTGQLIHHPRGSVALYDRCTAASLVCALRVSYLPPTYPGSLRDFFVEHLFP